MCGRYSLTTPLDDLIEELGVDEVAPGDYPPRFNIAPTQLAPVLVSGPSGLRLGALRWGLIPHWAEDARIGSRMINARSESVARLPAFRESFRTRRCLVPADGFFEWAASASSEAGKGATKGRRTPYWIHRPDRRPFTLAGLWARWRAPDGEPVHSFTILTTEANARIRALHDRMPVVLAPADRTTWLDRGADPARLLALLRPAPEAFLEAWPVSHLVGSPDYDDPVCVTPIPEADARH